MILFLRFRHFWWENDITNLAPNFGFANMGYLMLLCLKELFTRISKPKKVLKYVNPIKRYNVLKFEFPAILLLQIAKTQKLKNIGF